MLELRLEPELEILLEQQATKAGQTKAEFARRAILDRLEDREDYEVGVAALLESEGKGVIPFAEVVKSLGMEAEFSAKGTKATGRPGLRRTKANSEVSQRKAAGIA